MSANIDRLNTAIRTLNALSRVPAVPVLPPIVERRQEAAAEADERLNEKLRAWLGDVGNVCEAFAEMEVTEERDPHIAIGNLCGMYLSANPEARRHLEAVVGLIVLEGMTKYARLAA
jgi:hypothetical protein